MPRPSGPGPRRIRALACGLLASGLFPIALGAAEAEDEPAGLFEVRALRVPGRALEVVPAHLGFGPEGAGGERPRRGSDLVVVAVTGTPPAEVRRLVAFEGGPAWRLGEAARWTLDVPAEVAAFDVGPIGDGGDGVALLSANALRLVRPGAAGRDVIRPLAPPAPLPPRARGLSRLPLLADWDANGHPAALVPSLGGARLLPLGGGPERLLAVPVHAEYATRGEGPPAQDEWLRAELTWPVLERADDDGDGRLDLYALSRFGAAVLRAGPSGLASEPARRVPLRPFTPAEERRHRATSLRQRALDLDGDGRADLFAHRNAGTLLRSRALTEIFWNRGANAPFGAQPDVSREESDALVTCDPVDLDGDGRSELFETRVAFGIVQIARALATRRFEVDVRLVALARDAAPRTTWSGEISLRLDFAQGRVVGLVPSAEGDWNGDGRRDLLYGTGADGIALQLGEAGPLGPAFGPVAGTQAVRAEGHAVVVDVDGDGLDDLVVHDPMDEGGVVRVLRNLGTLPGTPRAVRSADPRATKPGAGP